MGQWVILELNSHAQGEAPEVIRASLQHHLRGAEIYLPATTVQSGLDKAVKWLFDGYAFVRRDFPDERFLRLPERARFVEAVVMVSAGRLATVKDEEIARLREQTGATIDQGIAVGDEVLITSGPYRNLPGEVYEDFPERDMVQVHVKLRSQEALLSLPRGFLSLSRKAAPDPWVKQASALASWFRSVLPVLRWTPSRGLFEAAADRYLRLDRWAEQGQRHARVMVGLSSELDPVPLAARYIRYHRLNDLAVRGKRAAARVVAQQPLRVAEVEGAYLRWLLLSDLLDRCIYLSNRMSAQPLIVIDGLNLLCRCAMAPGLSEMRDKQGRPTGGLVGMFNALASWKKRWPDGHFVVAWDSPCQWRRDIFPGYKASRGSLGVSFEMQFARATLPLLGVGQAEAAGQEADDVIASLATQADGQVIAISNDRDLLQLVSDTVTVFSPTGKEKMYTPAEVQADYGVLPGRMVQVRALAGDTSDEIPGVPGCGLKTAAKLINLYGTVEGLLASNLAGVGKALYTNLRASEAVARRNVALMTLRRDLVVTETPAAPDEAQAWAQMDQIDFNPQRIKEAFFPRQTRLL